VDRLTKILVSFFGLGYAPFAMGTWGTAGAVLVAWFLPAGDLWPVTAAVVFALACVITAVLGGRAERLAGKKDPGIVVTDEVAGYFVTIAWIPKPEIGYLLAGFFVFRVFDVWKPWPVRRLEAIGGGTGILLDDLAAGVYGLILLTVVRYATGWSGAL
jgi:phosphatidylglycerophosphatase A